VAQKRILCVEAVEATAFEGIVVDVAAAALAAVDQACAGLTYSVMGI
jgi:hypothetical protein